MQIRHSTTKDIESIVEIWLNGSIVAHHFIDPNYWHSKIDDMAQIYLPMSLTYVLERDDRLIGFVSMMDDYLAALFIDLSEQNNGYGKYLLEYVKSINQTIQLKVYQQNKNAVRFYLNNGFFIKDELVDDQTAEKEYLMTWAASGGLK
ncbi:N-acetyltransferase [Ammoniphilus resinae]|uniref:Acetyltransferase n=1 Tax=Ammoniphilus resinae TaxID=861532 RepID=A0ABS4GLF3_9BACL|nr:N-acetyltransferase [Ammoniphilus resinae]MBP1931095.1 putative acetyltransferase [Ammoniphilus resinae]